MKVISCATLNNQKIGQNIHINQESRQLMHTSKDIRNNVTISISIAFIFIFFFLFSSTNPNRRKSKPN